MSSGIASNGGRNRAGRWRSLRETPELINQDPYGNGWIAVVEPNDPESELCNVKHIVSRRIVIIGGYMDRFTSDAPALYIPAGTGAYPFARGFRLGYNQDLHGAKAPLALRQ